jgi:sarcosine oxidase, subunit beta
VITAGFSGMGFKISPAVGHVVAASVLDGTPDGFDLTPFRPSRFADGDPIVPPHPYADD